MNGLPETKPIRVIELEATIADLRSQLREAYHQIEGMQAHIDNVVHPDDCSLLWKAQVEDLRSQLEAAQRVREEYRLERDQADEKLQAAQRERDNLKQARDLSRTALIEQYKVEVQAERTKREEAEDKAGLLTMNLQVVGSERDAAERRLGEALAALRHYAQRQGGDGEV